MAAEQKIIDISVNYSKAVNDLITTKNAITQLKLENVELSKDMAANGGQVLANNAQIKNLTTTLNQNTKAVQNEILQVKGSEGAYQKLNLQYQLSAQKAKDIAAAQGVNSAASIKASKEANDLNDKLKAIDKTVGQNQRSVGDYGIAMQKLPGIFGEMQEKGQSVLVALRTRFESVKDATMDYSAAMMAQKEAQAAAMAAAEAASIAELELSAAKKMGTATSEMEAVAETTRATATEAATVATEASATSMQLFKIALASTGIGLIVVLLGSLIAYFTQTNEGSKLLSKSISVVGAVFKELFGFVAKGVQSVRDFIEGIKSFPDLMSKIGTAIEENVMNRFKAFGVIFDGINKLIHGNMSGIKDVTDGFFQLGTGITNVTDKLASASKAIASGVADAASEAARIAEMKRSLGLLERQSITTLAALEAKAAEYKVIMGKAGQSLSVKEREDAINGLIKNEDEQLRIKLNIASKKAAIAKAELDLEQKQTGDAMSDTKRAYAEAQAELIKIRGEFNVNKMTIDARAAKLYVQILTEQLTAEKDIYTQSKALLDNRLKNEKLSFEEKIKIIEDLKTAENTSYNQQTESFQQYLNSTKKGKAEIINFNELLTISDGQALQARMNELKLSIPAQKLLLTLLNDRKTAVIDTNQTELNAIKEHSTKLIAAFQDEIKLNDLKNKELRAGRTTTFQEDQNDLLEKLNNEISINAEKLKSDQNYVDQSKLIYQQYDTDLALLDVQHTKNMLQNKANQLSGELTIHQGNLDLETELKKQQLDMQMAEELKVADLTESQITSIKQKHKKLQQKIDQESFSAKLDMAAQVTSGLADLLGKDTEAGKFAAASTVGIQGAQSAFKTGATAAEYFASGNIPMGILAGIETGIIVANTAKSIADIYAVNTDVTAAAGTKNPTVSVSTKLHDGGKDQPDNKLKSDEITRTLLKTERVLSPAQTGIFDNIVRNMSLQGGSAQITNNIGMNQIDQSLMIEAAMTRAFSKMPPTQLSLVEWNNFQARQLLLTENKQIK